jgi:hypothetical protein
MCAHATGAENGWEHLGHGIHVCSIYKNKEDQFAPVAPFYSEGLNKGERCLYIFDENTKEEIATKILEKGIAPNVTLLSKSFRIRKRTRMTALLMLTR